jgi:hypothetical protein
MGAGAHRLEVVGTIETRGDLVNRIHGPLIKVGVAASEGVEVVAIGQWLDEVAQAARIRG